MLCKGRRVSHYRIPVLQSFSCVYVILRVTAGCPEIVVYMYVVVSAKRKSHHILIDFPPWGVPKVEMMVVGRGVNIHQWYVIGLCAHTRSMYSDGLSKLVLMCQIVTIEQTLPLFTYCTENGK